MLVQEFNECRRCRLEVFERCGVGSGWKADSQGKPCVRSERGVYEAVGIASIATARARGLNGTALLSSRG